MLSAVGLAVVCAVASGCVPHKIPGTDLDDNDDTRAVLDVINTYRRAVEKHDVAALIALAHETFRDDGGSASPEDDLDYASLATTLPDRLKEFQELRLDVVVKRVEFEPGQNQARVTYTYQMTFKLPEYSSRAQSETEIKQMTLRRVDKGWKITSGI